MKNAGMPRLVFSLSFSQKKQTNKHVTIRVISMHHDHVIFQRRCLLQFEYSRVKLIILLLIIIL